jgi:oxygen-independent coproporphyrinogen-3 oxidase
VPGVYLAYPFCAQKCTFCNFASGVFPRELEARYLGALRAEIRAHAWQWTPETVYWGGGTPGNLDPGCLREILETVPGRPWLEATIESAPGGLTAEKARAWAACGINRVSLGVQSFVEKEIRRAGRKHTAQTVVEELRLLQSAGIRNCNIDLIAGLSGQTVSSWRESLDWIERLAPPHVSVYMLEVDEDSRLGREMLRGGARYGAAETPSEEQVVEFYEMAVERLAALGTPRYEISNFARPGFESRHNLKYWTLDPYAGFGADAHSFDGRVRRENPESVLEYTARMESSGELTDESVCPTRGTDHRFLWSVGMGLRLAQLHEKPGLTGETACPTWPELVGQAVPPAFFDPVEAAPDRRRNPIVCPTALSNADAARLTEERFFLGLRLSAGIRPAPGEWRRFARPIRRFVDAGLLESQDGVIRLTSRGVLFSNEVFQEFIGL